MNSDTVRTLNDIIKNGWYASHTTMGEGGWAEVYKFDSDWKRYDLLIMDGGGFEPAMSIKAKDDATAISAFHQRFNLENVGYDISEKVITFRSVETNLEPA